jgi:hypothetical protein
LYKGRFPRLTPVQRELPSAGFTTPPSGRTSSADMPANRTRNLVVDVHKLLLL